MKTIIRAVVAVALTMAFAFIVARATEPVSPPSNHTGQQIKTPYKANAEDFSGQNLAPGRFQLFQGSTLISAAGDSTTMPAVLKIDSQTGRTWLLVITDATGTTNFGFVELPTVDRH